MKYGILFLLLILLTVGATNASAQSYYQKETALYAEIFGTGGELSAQFEKLVAQTVAFRVGIGFTGVAFREGYVVPFGVSVFVGGGRNLLEIGVGGSWIDFDDNGSNEVIFDLQEDQVVANGIFGYRFIGDYGFTYRLAFTPAYTKDGFKAMGGAAFGYAF